MTWGQYLDVIGETHEKIGEERGEYKKLIEQVCKKLLKGMNIVQIAKDLEEDEINIANIVNAAEPFAPEYNVDEIYEALNQ